MPLQNVDSAAHKVLNNETVESTHHDCVPPFYVSELAFDYLDTHDRSYTKKAATRRPK
ncbi:hypothetical protein D3C80_1797860 [compost metagenome]